MKQTTYYMLLVVFLWAVSVAAIFVPSSQNIKIMIALTSSFLFLSLVLLFLWVMKLKMRKLHQDIKDINIDNYSTKNVSSDSYGEMNLIANQINQFLTDIKTVQEKQSKHDQDMIQDLKKKNLLLKNQLTNRHSSSSKSIKDIGKLLISQFNDNDNEFPDKKVFDVIFNKVLKHAERHHIVLGVLLLKIGLLTEEDNILDLQVESHLGLEIGKIIKRALRSEDVLSKLSNDSFIILLNKVEHAKFVSIVAEKILKAFSEPVLYQEKEIPLIAKIGICVYPEDSNMADVILHNLETAISRIEKLNVSAYEFYNQETNLIAHEFIELNTALHKSIENNELALYYQPKLNVKKGTIVGFEALLRWNNPNLGTITPTTFVVLAEQTGFYMQLASWVIREACSIIKSCQQEGYEHMTISIKLTKKQFHDENLIAIISRTLAEFKLDPQYLEVEIDEKTMMTDVEATSIIMGRIKTAGVGISLDHFGVGYTAISYLKKFPINSIKIDRSFIKGIPNKPDDAIIVNSFIALAHKLGLEVIAEGVETPEQVKYLADENCDLIQGYYVSYPLPVHEMKSKLAKISEVTFL